MCCLLGAQSFRETERYLLRESFAIPIYFSFDDAAAAMRELVAAASGTDAITLDVETGAPISKIDKPEALNMHTILSGAGSMAAEGAVPATIFIVAHYDALAAAPSLAFGADSNASGTSVLLALARLFASAYASPRTHATYNLVFVLTGAGKLNFAGAREWLDSAASRLKHVEMVLCLDGLAGPGDTMTLHMTSAPPPGSGAARFVRTFEETGAEFGLAVSVALAPAADGGELAWEHERFARAKYPAATLSARARGAGGSMAAPDMLDSAANETALLRAAAFVAEALARHVFGVTGAKRGERVFDSAADLNAAHLLAWQRTLAATPRFAPLLGADSALVSALGAELGAAGDELVRGRVPLASQLTAFSAAPVVLVAAAAKPVYFEIGVLLAALAVLAAVKAAVEGPRAVLEWAASWVFRKKAKRA